MTFNTVFLRRPNDLNMRPEYILFYSVAFLSNTDDISHSFAQPDNLISAYKGHELTCGEKIVDMGNKDTFLENPRVDIDSSKSVTGEYDKYGNFLGSNGLIDESGKLGRGALRRILSSSLESGLDIGDAVLKKRMDSFSATRKAENALFAGLETEDGAFGTRTIKGYNPEEEENLLDVDDENVTKNIECHYPSDGYGYQHCTNNKIIGEHYDLTNRIGPYRLNAHFESPSKVRKDTDVSSKYKNAYKNVLVTKRVGLNHNDLLLSRISKACADDGCKRKYPAHGDGVHRFKTPEDALYDVY